MFGYLLLGLASSLLLFAAGVGSGLVMPTAASAHQARSCLGGYDYGAINSAQFSDNEAKNRGTSATVSVVAPSKVSCQHITSVYGLHGQGFFEFGYLIGFTNCNGNTHYYTKPVGFWTAVNSNGVWVGCGVFGGKTRPPASSNHAFRASDINRNYYWGAWYDGHEWQPNGVLMDFNSSRNAVSMERATSSDTGYAKFTDMSEYHDVNGWTHWDNIGTGTDADPTYSPHYPNHHQAVYKHD